MATALLTAVPPLPQVAGGHHEEPGCRVQVPGIAAPDRLLMGAHDERVVSPAGIEAPWIWHCQPQVGPPCPVAVGGPVEDEQPRGEAVLAPACRRDQALVGTAADAVGQPLGEGVGIGRSPATVALKPCVCVPDRPSSVEVHRPSMASSCAQVERGRRDRAGRGSPRPTHGLSVSCSRKSLCRERAARLPKGQPFAISSRLRLSKYSRQALILPSRNSVTPTTGNGPARDPSGRTIQSTRSVNTTSPTAATLRYSTSRLLNPICCMVSISSAASSGPVVVGNPACSHRHSSRVRTSPCPSCPPSRIGGLLDTGTGSAGQPPDGPDRLPGKASVPKD